MLQQLITSFIASAAFGLLFNAPRNTLLQCGLIGMVGWLFYFFLVEYRDIDPVAASIIASFIIAVISGFFARWFKAPIIIFNVAGIIPLVPGGLAYDSMRHFVINDYSTALQLAAKVLLISGAIAVGLVFSEVMNQMLKKVKPTK
nr:threonine/serine exporter family protein [uncultured Bacillus sp.]